MAVSDRLLRRHVIESNRIEGIRARPGTPLYDGHLKAARLAARGMIVHPNVLHKLLAGNVPKMRSFAGQYRRTGMELFTTHGKRRVFCSRYRRHLLPRGKHIPALMDEWLNLVEQFKKKKKQKGKKKHDIAIAARFLHAWLLCIHPYEDGNGRTARLVWNMLRVYRGLPWLIVGAKNAKAYYAHIRAVEEQVFRKEHSDVYPRR